MGTDGSPIRADKSSVHMDKSSVRTDGSCVRADRSSIHTDKSSTRADKSSVRADRSSVGTYKSSMRADISPRDSNLLLVISLLWKKGANLGNEETELK